MAARYVVDGADCHWLAFHLDVQRRCCDRQLAALVRCDALAALTDASTTNPADLLAMFSAGRRGSGLCCSVGQG